MVMTALHKRPLGNTGLLVSCLGLGTVKFGRNQQVKYPSGSGFVLPSDREIQQLLALASETGINLLDTAPAYGSSELRLGQLLSNRERWVLSSKVGEEFIRGQSVFNFSRDQVQNSIERSLRNLRTDYLDIALIHSDGNDLQILESTDCVETLQRLKDRGLVRSIGLSGKTVEGGLRALQWMDVAMVTYNTVATAEAEVIDYAESHEKGILVKKALHSGHLSRSAETASGNGDKPATALEFALSRTGVSSVIIGTINPSHLLANARVALTVSNQ